MNTNRLWTKLKWLGMLWILWHCAGCDREYLKYDTEKKDCIYMLYGDTIEYAMVAGAPEQEYEYGLAVQVMGMPKPYERNLRLEVIDSLTTAKEGLHYQLKKDNIFPRDTAYSNIYITLFKDKDPGLRENPVVLALRLAESEDFRVVPVEKRFTELYLFVSVTPAPKPGWWLDQDLGEYTEQAAFMFMKFFHEMEQKNPVVYKRITDKYGVDLKYVTGFALWQFWNNNRIVIHKYVIRPLYDYYQDHPEPGVNIPEPQY